MKKILGVKVVQKPDDSPDLSHLGEYSNTSGEPDVTIDRRGRRGTDRFSKRYFIAAMSAKDTGNPNSVEQDYERFQAFNRGEFNMIGIYATTDVQLSDRGVIQKIRSGGLWGIESDSDREYLESVAKEELDNLRDELRAIGFTDAEIEEAYSNRE